LNHKELKIQTSTKTNKGPARSSRIVWIMTHQSKESQKFLPQKKNNVKNHPVDTNWILTLRCLGKDAHRNKVFKHIQRITLRYIPSLGASHLHSELITIWNHVREMKWWITKTTYQAAR
jgi:hypothetical protein